MGAGDGFMAGADSPGWRRNDRLEERWRAAPAAAALAGVTQGLRPRDAHGAELQAFLAQRSGLAQHGGSIRRQAAPPGGAGMAPRLARARSARRRVRDVLG